MANSYQLTKDDVVVALKEAIVEWRNIQGRVLRSIELPYLSKSGDEVYKAAGWANVGFDAAKTFFPKSAVVTVVNEAVGKLAIPFYVAGKLQEGFSAIHQHQLDRDNALLKQRYTNIVDNLDTLMGKIAKDFCDSDFGRGVTEKIVKVYRDNGIKFLDSVRAVRVVRDHISNSGIIEQDASVLRKRLEEGVIPNCKKIYDIYRGKNRFEWPDNPNQIMYAKNEEKSYQPAGNGYYGANYNFKQVKSEKDRLWILANVWRMKVWHIDKSALDNQAIDTTYVVKLDHPVPIAAKLKTFNSSAVAFDQAAAALAQTVRT